MTLPPDLTKLERDEQIAEWIEITERVQSYQADTIESRRSDGRGHRPEGGINAAARELGVDKADAHRTVMVASLSPEAKHIARGALAGQGNNPRSGREVSDRLPYMQRPASFATEAFGRARLG